MRNRNMTEPEAYRWLQRKAMNENRKLAHVVAELVKRKNPNDPTGTR
jgi:response regulator NasT